MKTCKIIIQDEVNVKFQGLDLDDRKTLMRMFEYEKPGARYQPSVRLGRWNGKVSYFSLGGMTYINLLPEILPLLDQAGYDIELEDLRTYKTNFTLTAVTEDTFSNYTWPKGHPDQGKPIKLRDYQVSVINNFLSNPQSIQEVATGAGKTITTAALSYSIQEYGRSIVIVPNKSLVTQTEEDYRNVGLDVGVYFGDRKEYGKTHTICTWQSLSALIKKSKELAEPTIGNFLLDVVCVICDEVHGAKADQLKSMLTSVMATIPVRWGLTGTIPKEKFNALALEVSIGQVVGKLSASELQDKGVLSNCHVHIVQYQDKKEFRDYQSELKYLLSDQKRMVEIAKLINSVKVKGNTLVLVDRISAGDLLLELIPNAVFVNGGTKTSVRKAEYESISVAENKVIIATYQVAAVGINIPRIFNVVLIEPGKSFVRTIQSIGRGLRMAHDKNYVDIWDLTSSCKFSKRHLTKRKEFYKDSNYPYSMDKLEYL